MKKKYDEEHKISLEKDHQLQSALTRICLLKEEIERQSHLILQLEKNHKRTFSNSPSVSNRYVNMLNLFVECFVTQFIELLKNMSLH